MINFLLICGKYDNAASGFSQEIIGRYHTNKKLLEAYHNAALLQRENEGTNCIYSLAVSYSPQEIERMF